MQSQSVYAMKEKEKHGQHPVSDVLGGYYRLPDQTRYEMVAIVVIEEDDDEGDIMQYMIPALNDLYKINGDDCISCVVGNMLIISKPVDYMPVDKEDRTS